MLSGKCCLKKSNSKCNISQTETKTDIVSQVAVMRTLNFKKQNICQVILRGIHHISFPLEKVIKKSQVSLDCCDKHAIRATVKASI